MIQRGLLAEPDLKFAKAFKLAQSMEAVAKNVKELHQPNTDTDTGFTRSKDSCDLQRKREEPHLLPAPGVGNKVTPRLNADIEEPNVTTVVKRDTSMQAVCRSKLLYSSVTGL